MVQPVARLDEIDMKNGWEVSFRLQVVAESEDFIVLGIALLCQKSFRQSSGVEKKEKNLN